MKKWQEILDLKPTQFALGMLEVDEKIRVAKKMKRRELDSYLKDNVVPVIISPHNEIYIVDHHHFLCVCHNVGIKKVRIKVRKDLSKSAMSFRSFWKWMKGTKNFYPFCQFGEGPREALYLPKDIRGLADDPYRSLAWFVRKTGAFNNSEKTFAEFKWANFFRSKQLLTHHGIRGFTVALTKAVRLSKSKQARHLPGFEELNRVSNKDLKKTKERLVK